MIRMRNIVLTLSHLMSYYTLDSWPRYNGAFDVRLMLSEMWGRKLVVGYYEGELPCLRKCRFTFVLPAEWNQT